MCIAATKGRTKVTSALLAKGADMNQADNYGWTPMIRAAFNGQTEVVQRLVLGLADQTMENTDGKTALDYARRFNHPIPNLGASKRAAMVALLQVKKKNAGREGGRSEKGVEKGGGGG